MMLSKVTVRAAIVCAAASLFAAYSTRDAQAAWRFVVTCDSRGNTNGINEKIATEIAAEVIKHGADFLLFPGDLVSGYTASNPDTFESQLWAWVKLMQPLYDAGIGVYVGRGNHETADLWSHVPLDPNDNFATRWINVFGSDLYPRQKLLGNGPAGEKYMTYSLIHKNALVLMLDHYAGTQHQAVHKVNQSWVDEQLAANTQTHVFIVGHEAAFRALHTDCLDNHIPERDAFWNSLQNAGARAYFCGHDHFYEHARIDDGDRNANNDIHQFIIGTAGAWPYSWWPPFTGNNSHYTPEEWFYSERYGYLLVEIDDLTVKLTYMARDTWDLSTPGVYLSSDVWAYTVVPGLMILSPNGGERLLTNFQQPILWRTLHGANIDQVSAEYSLDAGATWQQIGVFPNTGSCLWQPPSTSSSQCLIRVSNASDATTSDTSDTPFTIFNCNAKLKADLNADCYVNHLDFLIMADEWLQCGNPFDSACPTQP
jgi:hypothetical protein